MHCFCLLKPELFHHLSPDLHYSVTKYVATEPNILPGRLIEPNLKSCHILNFNIFTEINNIINLQTQEETSESKEEEEENEQRGDEVTKLSEYQILEQTYQNVSSKNWN